MAFTHTVLADLINPQVIADIMDKKLIDNIVFSPLCYIDTTLVGRPGSVITVPSFNYIGDASVVSEGSDITYATLSAASTSATIHKIAVGVQLSDEAVLSGFGDPVGEAVDQMAKSIGAKMDKEVLGVLEAITGTMLYETASTSTELAVEDIAKGLTLFGEDIDGQKCVVVSPKLYELIRLAKDWCPASEFAANALVEGAVGRIFGCDIIVSNKLKGTGTGTGTAYIVKPGAVRIYMKRGVEVETDRNITNKTTQLTADTHEVCYLYDSTKAVKLAKKA